MARRRHRARAAPALVGRARRRRARQRRPDPRLRRRTGSRTRCSRFALEQPLPGARAALAWHARGYGDFWAHMLVAEGAVDGAVDAVGVTLWDLAAIQPIVEEAGGPLHGLRRATPASTAAAAISSNGHLHEELLRAVRSAG